MSAQVSGKLIDKEQTLEEEIQLRERMQLQCKQAERMVEDLKMELQTANQAKEDLAKQVKLAQVLFQITKYVVWGSVVRQIQLPNHIQKDKLTI